MRLNKMSFSCDTHLLNLGLLSRYQTDISRCLLICCLIGAIITAKITFTLNFRRKRLIC